ncbi:MAG: hypothetical protein A2297_03485 [Elusimicrobia bacterium RIFOXYB2_FULL_48_7]|nr:MAG: hypothetical protein A2297_03485 [Elusimicrobia bacterium RIFOXYB2_FULL_48_7]
MPTAAKEVPKEQLLEELMLNTKLERYKIIPLIARWAYEIKNKEEYKTLPFHDMLDIAMRDVYSGKVSLDEIAKLPPVIESINTPFKKSGRKEPRDERKEK